METNYEFYQSISAGLGDGKVQIQNIDVRFRKVADLINDENNAWKEDIIEDIFTEEQVEKILAIPLVNNSFLDGLVWRGDNIGEYSIKSGYKWCITSNHNGTKANNYKI
ncbi:reverse transcriptase [Gossypium australe]|uniref:Reverse transcriptase n=1 Tax=Gossypium australe TaxID=47621 RepID=A0A5B6X1X4_9ROSI|nr:reverse transcriptase [Gossypium australe]